MGWGVTDVEIKLCVVPDTKDVLKGHSVREIFYVFVEKENFEETLEKSSIPKNSFQADDL